MNRKDNRLSFDRHSGKRVTERACLPARQVQNYSEKKDPEQAEMTKVYYFGLPGSFSHIAAMKRYASNTNLVSKEKLSEVFASVRTRPQAFGVVPIENSTNGSVAETYDQLKRTGVHVAGEIILRVHHAFLAKGKKVRYSVCYSHYQAIAQCSKFLSKYKSMEIASVNDTASAAKSVAQSANRHTCAISSERAARIYGLTIVQSHIEDDPDNFTRFAILSSAGCETGRKMMVTFTVKHEPGTLVSALHAFSDQGLNLTKIESRPMKGKKWEYEFYADIESQKSSSSFDKALEALKTVTRSVRILGRYNDITIYES